MPEPVKKSRWALLVADWHQCGRCELSRFRRRVCIAKGDVPCDFAFVGEGPGDSENLIGQPFMGPAGDLLDRIVRGSGLKKATVCLECEAQGVFDLILPHPETGEPGCAAGHGPEGARPIRVGYSNLVGCLPVDLATGKKDGEPDDEFVEACRPRLEEWLDMCSPRLLMRVGKLAGQWIDPQLKGSIRVPGGTMLASMIHPASILKGPVVNRELSAQRCVAAVRTAMLDMARERAKEEA
jgi:uracil-DNA glycosylase